MYWFCHTLTWICHGAHVLPILNPLPPPSPSHPSGSSQCTRPQHPASCIETGLVIRFTYDNIQVSMPFSQIIPPSPSPTESKGLFYASVSLLLREQILKGLWNGNPLQYFCLETSMDRGAWQATVHEVTKSRTWLNN